MKQASPRNHRRLLLHGLLGAALGLFFLPTLWSNPGVCPEPSAAANKYIGSKKCKNCHDAEASGDQWAAWGEATHSKAFEVLSSDKAKEIASERGIADASKSDECLRCHQTAFGKDKKELKKSFDPKGGVGCESCHGPGDKHARARFRAANEEDEDDEGFGDEEEEVTFTEIPADEISMDISPKLCVECHNTESPTYKPFCYYERVSKIRHLNPLKPRTDKERAALLVCGCGDACKCDHECAEGCGVPPKKK